MARDRGQKSSVKDYVKSIRIKKNRIWYVVLSMVVETIAWIMFLVYFGRIDPVIRATLDAKLHSYELVAVPFWTYSIGSPVLFPIIAVYILNGNKRLGMISNIVCTSLIIILGGLLNVTSSILHGIKHLDQNKHTANVVIAGLFAIILAILNLLVIQIVISVFEGGLTTATEKNPALPPKQTSSGPSHDYVYSDDDVSKEPPALPPRQRSSGPSHDYMSSEEEISPKKPLLKPKQTSSGPKKKPLPKQREYTLFDEEEVSPKTPLPKQRSSGRSKPSLQQKKPSHRFPPPLPP